MKLLKKPSYAVALVAGLAVGAFAGPPPTIPEVLNTNSYTNCPNPLYGCNLWNQQVSTIDPFCCSENLTTCTNYQVQTWTCNAGGTRYRYFQADSPTLPGENCGTDAGCY